MDGLNLAASAVEIRSLTGGKIDRIHQPQRDVIILCVHKTDGNYRLLLSASPEGSRAQLTNRKFENPIDAPMFCMLLRKRIMGGRIISVTQPNLDRLLLIGIEARSEIGDTARYTLAVELMGRHSNIILIGEDGVIIDCIRRVDASMSHARMVLPNFTYELPPAQDKKDPLHASAEDFLKALSASKQMKHGLVASFFGVSPDMAEALIERVTDRADFASLGEGEKGILAKSLHDFYTRLGQGEIQPCLLLNGHGEPIRVFPFLPNASSVRKMPTMCEALDAFYGARDVMERMRRMSLSYRRILKNNIERCERKLAMFFETLNSVGDMQQLKLYGELLTANMHALHKGAEAAVVMNYYADPPAKLTIPLDPRLSPIANAQRYYKRYQKAKVSYEMAQSRMEETREELLYLEGLLHDIDLVTTDAEMLDIRDELSAGGYLGQKDQKRRERPRKAPASSHMRFVAGDGTEILAGKNNKQNDHLTFVVAGGEDVWLHAKDVPGSHVIIRSGEPSKQTLYEAALIAAYYSKARMGKNVGVDYTKRKNVKKPSGAKPGMVVYAKHETAYVTPDEGEVKAILGRGKGEGEG